jgi:hypothetical protein
VKPTLLLLSLVAAGASGCFSPSYSDCQLSCAVAEPCPGELSCVDGFCRVSASPSQTCENIVDPDDLPVLADAGPDGAERVDARPGEIVVDASSGPGPIDAAVLPGPIDAATPPPPIDAAVPPGPVDAAVPPTDGLCDESQPPVTPPCGGQVLCVKSIVAQHVKARVIFAKDVQVDSLDADCVWKSPGENAWTQGNGGGNLNQPSVVADVIYVKDLDATTIEVIELRAKTVVETP